MNKASTRGSTAKIIVIIVIIAILAIVSLVSAFVLFYKPASGTGDPLPFGTETGTLPVDTGEVPDSGAADTSPADTQGAGNYIPREGFYNFLVMGYDKSGSNTDVMMLLNFDVNSGKITIMQIPRDTYVEVGMKSHKINAVFGAYRNSSQKTGDAAVLESLLNVKTLLEQNLCIKIHYSAIMDLVGFNNIVDAVGGVYVDIPFDMDYDDPVQDLHIHFKAGNNQYLDGKDAERFVRFRDSFVQADIGRGNAQKIFMAAFLRQVKSNLPLDMITKVAGEVMNYVVTDIPAADLLYFAKKAYSVDLSSMTMITLPGIDAYGKYYIMHRAKTLEYINSSFNIYDTAISNGIFDKNLIFTDEADSLIYDKYLGKDYMIDYEYTGEDAINGDISIPILKSTGE